MTHPSGNCSVLEREFARTNRSADIRLAPKVLRGPGFRILVLLANFGGRILHHCRLGYYRLGHYGSGTTARAVSARTPARVSITPFAGVAATGGTWRANREEERNEEECPPDILPHLNCRPQPSRCRDLMTITVGGHRRYRYVVRLDDPLARPREIFARSRRHLQRGMTPCI